MLSLQRAVIVATLGLVGCARETPTPEPVIVERVVYVEREPEPERLPPGEPIAESPLVVAAEQDRAENHAERVELEAAKAPRVVYAPTPAAAVVIVRDLPPSQRKHTRWHYDRAAERCERRATRWARERCLREAVR